MNIDDEEKDNENDNNAPPRIDDSENYDEYLKFQRTAVYSRNEFNFKL